jgi:RNA polymerase sigma factor (TIGR02999 family)
VTTRSSTSVTELVRAWSSGDDTALERLALLIEPELRRLARRYMARERSGHTLQATALVNETFIRLIDARRLQWHDRAQLIGICARLMRRVLVDHARAHACRKRGGGLRPVTLTDLPDPIGDRTVDVLALDDALERLAALDPRKAKVIDMRFFGGLSVDEVAHVLDVHPDTVKRDWRVAKLWLLRELKGGTS